MPTQLLGSYVNHAGSCRDGAGNLFALATQVRTGENNDAAIILKRDVRTGAWSEAARLDEATFGKPGFGTLQNVAKDLHLIYSAQDSYGDQVLMYHVIPGVCESWRDAIAAQITQALAGLTAGNALASFADAIGDAVAPFRK